MIFHKLKIKVNVTMKLDLIEVYMLHLKLQPSPIYFKYITFGSPLGKLVNQINQYLPQMIIFWNEINHLREICTCLHFDDITKNESLFVTSFKYICCYRFNK